MSNGESRANSVSKISEETAKLAKVFEKYKIGGFMAVKFICIIIPSLIIIKPAVDKLLQICTESLHILYLITIVCIAFIVFLAIFAKEDRKLLTSKIPTYVESATGKV